MMPRRTTVLEDVVKYRDGKKWKPRYCVLSKSDSKTGVIIMDISKNFGNMNSNQTFDEKSARPYFSDEITGFEYGRHVDKEGSVMALIGQNVVYCIAFSQNETMFRWADTLNKHFKYHNFHVTLKKLSETSGLFNKITPGIQGNLHVQSMRLCLIGEPADGNKFICEWPIENINSIDIFNSDCDKIKGLVIKSTSKLKKVKGNFEFEVSITNTSTFKSSFETFIKSCQTANADFKTNFKIKRDSVDTNQENISFSNSILSQDMNRSNSDNSSSLEKRSSEIPIPRSREHSGPDQRPIDNVQIKIRKSNKNFVNTLNEDKKHLSLIESNRLFDHNSCLFDDDEEIADQVDIKNRSFLDCGLSQESSGVYVNGASSSTRETNLSTRISIQDDSGCGNLLSTSSTQNDAVNLPNFLPPCHRRCSHKENVLLSFYGSIVRSPFLLSNYRKYSQLLTNTFAKQHIAIKRNNSYNCVHLIEKIPTRNHQKLSHYNFLTSVTSQVTDESFHSWRTRIIGKIRDNSLFNMKETEYETYKLFGSSSHPLSSQLPFRSTREFHNSVVNLLQNGTECVTLFCYHHFLTVLNDLKTVISNLESHRKSSETVLDQIKYGFKHKQHIPNYWLEGFRSDFYKSLAGDNRSKRSPCILDLNYILLFEIANNICMTRRNHAMKNGSCDCIPRNHYMNNPTVELNSEKYPFEHMDKNNFKHSMGSRLVLCSSASTPDFRCYSNTNPIPKQKKVNEIKYQNLSSLDTYDTMNHTFPKQNTSLNKPESSDNKGGSFKKFRRKYSPSFLIPFFHLGSGRFSNTMFTRRKTPSTNSTVSEPICQFENKDHNNYYNIRNLHQPFTKRSLSVVLDNNYPYEDSKECHSYINVQDTKGFTHKPDIGSNNYVYSGPSSYLDDASLPEEILDPSRNYGDLYFEKRTSSKMKSFSHDLDNRNQLNCRRSSMSVVSNKSSQNYGTVRSTSYKRHGYSNVRQINPDIGGFNTSGNANISDYVNGNIINSSPQSTLSSSPGSLLHPCHNTLNYVTVMEHNSARKYSRPLTIYPSSDYTNNSLLESDMNDSSKRFHSFKTKRSWLTPQSSPVVDYCQIDFNCTYALKAIDRFLVDKSKFRDKDKDNLSKNCSPEDEESSMSFDQADNYSISSSCFRDRKTKGFVNKKNFRRFFARKVESTN